MSTDTDTAQTHREKRERERGRKRKRERSLVCGLAPHLSLLLFLPFLFFHPSPPLEKVQSNFGITPDHVKKMIVFKTTKLTCLALSHSLIFIRLGNSPEKIIHKVHGNKNKTKNNERQKANRSHGFLSRRAQIFSECCPAKHLPCCNASTPSGIELDCPRSH